MYFYTFKEIDYESQVFQRYRDRRLVVVIVWQLDL